MNTIVPQNSNPPQKQCTKCKNWYPQTLEFFQKHSRLGLQPRCKICRAEDGREYLNTHREESRLSGQQYHANNREIINAKHQQYRQTKKEEINARRRANYSVEQEKRLESCRKSYQNHKEGHRVRVANRRAVEINAPGIHTTQDIEDQYKRQQGKCYYCHQKVTWRNKHVDHVVPLTKGGSNDISNLVIACPPCNHSKGNKFLHEWSKGGRLF